MVTPLSFLFFICFYQYDFINLLKLKLCVLLLFILLLHCWINYDYFQMLPSQVQVERYSRYTDRISAVISCAEIRTVLTRYTASLRYRITMSKITE